MTISPRITAAFAAIAAAVREDGWRMAPVQRLAKWRATGAAFRRVCDDAAVDALCPMLCDTIDDEPGDLEPFVSHVVKTLKGRPITHREDVPTEMAGDPCMFIGDPDEITQRDLREVWYAGAASTREDGLRKGIRHAIATGGKEWALGFVSTLMDDIADEMRREWDEQHKDEKVNLPPDTTKTTIGDVLASPAAVNYYVGDAFSEEYLERRARRGKPNL